MVSDSLLRQFKDFLISENYSVGDKIMTEMELAEHFHVSRSKIREASTALCQQGILSKKARRGTILQSLDPELLSENLEFQFSLSDVNPADFQEARIVIEEAILPLAIRRITPAQLAELTGHAQKMVDCLDNPELADEHDKAFHLTLLKACGNRTLQTFGQVISSLFRKDCRKKYWDAAKVSKAAQDHLQLLAAIRDNDTPKALTIIHRHFNY